MESQNRARRDESLIHPPMKPLAGWSVTRNEVTLALLSVIVIAGVLFAHWPALSAQAVSFDDEQYLHDNHLVCHPSLMSAARFLGEVFTPSTVGGYYQPLTMISLMIDYALGGRPNDLRVFHRTSLALHAINSVLIVILLYMLFGEPWSAAMVGLLFGLHPLTTEPIPWVSERKTLLAAFFALLCLIGYVRYTRVERRSWYAFTWVMLVLALMSKPTTTPLPLLMLLMDYWPLGRISKKSVLEKVPFLATVAVSAVVTYVSQVRAAGVYLPTEYSAAHIPLTICHNVVFYLYKMVWPVHLTSHYPFPMPLSLADTMVRAGVIGTVILLVLLAVSLRWTRMFAAGWLFFFVGIFPTMGVIGFTVVIASHKFAYLPSVGLLMILAALLGRLWQGSSRMRWSVAAKVAIVVVVLVVGGLESRTSRKHLALWGDTKSLYSYMLSQSPRAALLNAMMADYYDKRLEFEKAKPYYLKAIELRPKYSQAYNNLGFILSREGKHDEAIKMHKKAIEVNARDYEAMNNLGAELTQQGKIDEAIAELRRAVEIKPGFDEAQRNLGILLYQQGKTGEAISHLEAAVYANPDMEKAHYYLGVALAKMGKLGAAVSHLQTAVRLKPDYDQALYGLGQLLLAADRPQEAALQFKEALRFMPGNVDVYVALAKALNEEGETEEAVRYFKDELTRNPNNTNLRGVLATFLLQAGRIDEAIEQSLEILRLVPDSPLAKSNLAWLLSTRQPTSRPAGIDPVQLAEEASRQTSYNNAEVLVSLAAAYASAARFQEAVATAQRALEVAHSAGQNNIITVIQQHMQFYQASQPYRE